MSDEALPLAETLAAVYRAVLRKLTATTITEIVDAEHDIKVLVLGDSQALQEMRAWVLGARQAAPMASAALPPAPLPVVPPMRSRPQGSLFL